MFHVNILLGADDHSRIQTQEGLHQLQLQEVDVGGYNLLCHWPDPFDSLTMRFLWSGTHHDQDHHPLICCGAKFSSLLTLLILHVCHVYFP